MHLLALKVWQNQLAFREYREIDKRKEKRIERKREVGTTE